MAKSPEQMAQAMIANMQEKTGKTLPQWLGMVKESGLAKHGQIVKHLKADHGMTHGFANLVAQQFLAQGKPEASADDLVAVQYEGPKEALRPIYDAVTKMVSSLGTDVVISPKKTYVSYRRNKQFALIQPSTRDRVDLGVNLKGEAAAGRLEDSASFNQMVSHRVRLTSKSDVNTELKGWLKKAYDAA
ncbi:MAG: DUF4287 domain-containing protein [Gammaproteobacteria bacterium]|nr:DUF4287 domain-containing protein [Gammaproteobacteria bacterium]